MGGMLMDAPSKEFALAGSLEELKIKGRLVVHGGHRPILVIYDRGRVFALDNRCPHMGFPLERGSVEDGILTCHWHHARFDLESGCTFDLWADDVPICPVEVRDGDVWVKTTFGHADPAAHWRERLADGLAHDLGLVIAKAVHGQLAADVPRADIVRQVALFGAQNRDGWSVGLTILTALANLLPVMQRRKPISPCSTARAAWRRTATARRRGGDVRRLEANPIRPRSSAGCGVGHMCAIARRPSAPCSRRLRAVSRRRCWPMPCSRPRPSARSPTPDTRSISSTRRSSASTSSAGSMRQLCCRLSSARWWRPVAPRNRPPGANPLILLRCVRKQPTNCRKCSLPAAACIARRRRA